MKYLGIDQSYTSSGFCIFNDDQMESVSLFKTSKEASVFDRAWNISEHILNIVKEHDIQYVAIEGLAFGIRGDATRDLAGLQFCIVTKLQQIAKVPVIIVAPRMLKKFATNNGAAKKKEMIDALPVEVLDHIKGLGYKLTTGLTDLTDAYFLAKFAIKDFNTVKKVGGVG